MWRRALRRGVLVTAEHHRPLKSLKVATVLDIGASRGQFSLLCRTLYPDARVHAFEPLDEPAATLGQLFHEDAHVTVHNVAIDVETGPRTMHVSGSDDSSSLLPIGPRQVTHFPNTAERAVETIEAKRLDACLSAKDLIRPVLVKVDVQGNELRTLQACGGLLDYVDHIYIEVSFEELYIGQALAAEVVSTLDSIGFTLRSVDNLWRGSHGWAVQADFLFSRSVLPNLSE